MRAIDPLLLVSGLLLATCAHADALYNLRASLENGAVVAGTVSIDAVAGTVTGESSVLTRNGVALSTFGAPVSQGVFAPAGLVPSYLFDSVGTNGYLFVGAVPGTTLVGYAGGELCAFASSAHCAYSDVFVGGVPFANVVQGILAPAGDTIRTFDLVASFANGYTLTGSVTIDTTIGFVLDEHATLFSGGVLVDTFYAPRVQSPFAPAGLTPSYLFDSIGANGVLLNVATPGGSLIDYGGGDLCASGTGLTCALSDLFVGGTVESDAITGRLTLRRAAVPEPQDLSLLLAGAMALWVGRRRRRRGPGGRALRGAGAS